MDDYKRGGDIDLLIISEKLRPIDKIRIKAMIFKELEEQKIDITISRDIERPFVKLALAQGVPL